MTNLMMIDGYPAKVMYDEQTEMLRGEFVGLNGGADFYATDTKSLREEGKLSLRAFLEECSQRGIAPKKHYSGEFRLRIDPELHRVLAESAAMESRSLNESIATLLSQTHQIAERQGLTIDQVMGTVDQLIGGRVRKKEPGKTRPAKKKAS